MLSDPLVPGACTEQALDAADPAWAALERLLHDAPAGASLFLPLAPDAPVALRQAAVTAAARGFVLTAR